MGNNSTMELISEKTCHKTIIVRYYSAKNQ